MVYQFNQITVDPGQYCLYQADIPVSVEPLVFDLLVYLIEHRDRVVTRDELLDKLWKGKVVSDAALGARIKDARKVTQDSGSRQGVIKTIHGRGYQFVAEVEESSTRDKRNHQVIWHFPEELPLPEEPSIAILPFTNMSGDPDQEFFSDGITEDIITALSKIKNLLVIARSSTAIYKDHPADVTQVKREQGVRYVLEGSVRKSNDRVRVTAQLIDATTGFQKWAENYDHELEDIFAVQDDITKNVAASLQVTLTEGEQARVFAGGTNSIEAWKCFVLGKALLERHVKESNFEACKLIERALQLDPGYVTAKAYLGYIHWENWRYHWGESPETSLDQAIEIGREALALEPNHADSHAMLGYCYSTRGDLDLALEMTEKAFVLAPSHAFITAISAAVLRQAGRLQDAISRIERAIRLCPFYPAWYLMVLGSSYHLLGDFDNALLTLRESVRREPESILILPWYLSALIESNDKEAPTVAADIMRIEPGFSRNNWAKPFGFKDPAVAVRLSKTLAKEGIPE